MTPEPNAIECRGLSKRFGSTVALDRLDLSVPAGSVFGFLGPNGAGKSTTIRILATLMQPSSGDASIRGAGILTEADRARRSVGYLPQEPAFPGWMRGREFLHFECELAGIPAARRAQEVEEALRLAGLVDAADRRVGGYSGGMKQRLGLAQAMVGTPPVLILDEPVSSLDPIGRREIIEIMDGLRDRATVFFSSHILADIDRVCDHVAILSKGKLLVQETMTGLKERYAQPVFEIDIGGDPTRLVEQLREQTWVQDVSVHGTRLRVLVRDVQTAEGFLPRAVLDAGLTLLRYEQVLPTLEDVFVRLVERGDEAA